jgi:hypothetical protein
VFCKIQLSFPCFGTIKLAAVKSSFLFKLNFFSFGNNLGKQLLQKKDVGGSVFSAIVCDDYGGDELDDDCDNG